MKKILVIEDNIELREEVVSALERDIMELEEIWEHQKEIIDQVNASKRKIEVDLNEKHAQLMNEALRAI